MVRNRVGRRHRRSQSKLIMFHMMTPNFQMKGILRLLRQSHRSCVLVLGFLGLTCCLCGCASPGRRLNDITVLRSSSGGVEIASLGAYASCDGFTCIQGTVQRKLGSLSVQRSLVKITALDASGTVLTNINVAYNPCPLRGGRVGQTSQGFFETRLSTRPETIHTIRASICSPRT